MIHFIHLFCNLYYFQKTSLSAPRPSALDTRRKREDQIASPHLRLQTANSGAANYCSLKSALCSAELLVRTLLHGASKIRSLSAAGYWLFRLVAASLTYYLLGLLLLLEQRRADLQLPPQQLSAFASIARCLTTSLCPLSSTTSSNPDLSLSPLSTRPFTPNIVLRHR
jgi:hypothetical protein